MDRIIQPHAGGVLAAPLTGTAPVTPPFPSAAGIHASKTTSDYLKAVRRRFWLVLLVGVCVILPGAIAVVRQPDVYRVSSQIRIDPPTFDHRLSTIVPNGSIGQESPTRLASYVPDKIAELHSPGLAETVAADPELNLSPPEMAQAIAELSGLQSRRVQNSNTFDLFLESNDPSRATILMNLLLSRFQQDSKSESDWALEKSTEYATSRMSTLQEELRTLEKQIVQLRDNKELFTVDDGNFYQEEYIQLRSILQSKKARHEDLVQQQRLAQLLGSRGTDRLPAAHPYQRKIDELTDMRDRIKQQLAGFRRTVTRYDNDPAVRAYSRQLQEINRYLEQLYRIPAAQPDADLSTTLLTYGSEEIRQLEREVQQLLAKMQDSMPDYRNFQSLLRQRESKQGEIDAFKKNLDVFALLKSTANKPVTIRKGAEEPKAPIGPNRKLNLAMVVCAGLGLGISLVCLLEAFDRRVKAPEHVTLGLSLPLLAVVPRMRRVAELHRGGHIWTAGSPNSTEADAYRNLRASLLGVEGRGDKPVVTLLVTSAKPGEGKTTTALNLAATCARAGERTLLLDVDLRRSSLAGVFEGDHDIGLVDVLRGDLPWQRALIRTDLPNLDFLPSGDPTGIPIEILGTLELRQLLEALSGHYHRVILDGPAVLGLADCRMLGRATDSALLVVRSGIHALDAPRRAKAMLEQSGVALAGVAFNALDEDLENWSSDTVGLEYAGTDSARLAVTRGLDSPTGARPTASVPVGPTFRG